MHTCKRRVKISICVMKDFYVISCFDSVKHKSIALMNKTKKNNKTKITVIVYVNIYLFTQIFQIAQGSDFYYEKRLQVH